jgi:hypothetical protein
LYDRRPNFDCRASAVALFALLLVAIAAHAEPASHAQEAMQEADARALAIKTLANELKVDPSEIAVVHLARFTWPNSALGCPRPGGVYTPSLVPGYLALLSHDKKEHRVHIGAGRAVVCDLARLPLKSSKVIVEQLEQMAVNDLAGKIGVSPDEITVTKTTPTVWPDGQFGCAGPVNANTRPVRGFRIDLLHNGRTFEYRAGMGRVAPCPDIQAQ